VGTLQTKEKPVREKENKMKLPSLLLALVLFAMPLAAQAPAPAKLSNLPPRVTQTILKVAYTCDGFNFSTNQPYSDPQCTQSSTLDLAAATAGAEGGNRFDGSGKVFTTPYNAPASQLFTVSPKGVSAHYADLPNTNTCSVSSDGLSLIFTTTTLVNLQSASGGYSYNLTASALYVFM
jgi:hypothetical protein